MIAFVDSCTKDDLTKGHCGEMDKSKFHKTNPLVSPVDESMTEQPSSTTSGSSTHSSKNSNKQSKVSGILM